MRVNVYAEEMTDRVEIIAKEIDGHAFTGLRFYMYLPATIPALPGGSGAVIQAQGPFIHRPGDDDSAAVTFWGKQDLRIVLRRALEMLDAHYAAREAALSSKSGSTRSGQELYKSAPVAVRPLLDAPQPAPAAFEENPMPIPPGVKAGSSVRAAAEYAHLHGGAPPPIDVMAQYAAERAVPSVEKIEILKKMAPIPSRGGCGGSDPK